MIDYRLYLVTDDPSRYHSSDWLGQIIAAVDGGVTCIQYRDTESDSETQYRRILALKDALRGRVPIIVNNDAELARSTRAEGVHVGQGDMPPEAVRAIVGGAVEIGLSITSMDDARRALPLLQKGYVNAVGIGPVFDARATKKDASEAMGLCGLSAICRYFDAEASCPRSHRIAIGGIKLENAKSVFESGVGSLAVVSAFSQSPDPKSVARDFIAEIS